MEYDTAIKTDNIRVCTGCKTEYPLTSEHYQTRRDNGILRYRRKCRNCRSIIKKKHYEANKEHTLGMCKKWKINNKDKIKKTNKLYYEQNKDTILSKGREHYHRTKHLFKDAKKIYQDRNKDKRSQQRKERYIKTKHKENVQQKKWYLRNKETHAQRGKEWRKNNRDRAGVYNHKRRIKIKTNSVHYTHKDVKSALRIQRSECFYCKSKIINKYHIDHVVPVSRGGNNGCGNIVVACVRCNCKKKQ